MNFKEDMMEKLGTMMLADDLALSIDKIAAKEQDFSAEQVYQVIDNLGILKEPIQNYFAKTEEEYYEQESDHKLTLLNLDQKLGALHDRILTNHVDGFVDKDEINLTYNHEDPYQDGLYAPIVDLHVLVYSLKVIGAVESIAAADLKRVLSKDAILSLGLAAHALQANL